MRPTAIYVERDGHVLMTDRRFDDENHLLGAISALVASAGRRIDFSEPVLETRLPDGSHLTVVLPPVAIDGPMLTIRKFAASPYEIDDLIRFGCLSLEAGHEIATHLVAARARTQPVSDGACI
jgi:pilus assembly protein CpaF